MTRTLDISQRQITALCKGAAKAGYAPIVQIGKVFVRLVPEDRAIHAQEKADVDEDEDIRL